jgi:hypothetical protein
MHRFIACWPVDFINVCHCRFSSGAVVPVVYHTGWGHKGKSECSALLAAWNWKCCCSGWCLWVTLCSFGMCCGYSRCLKSTHTASCRRRLSTLLGPCESLDFGCHANYCYQVVCSIWCMHFWWKIVFETEIRCVCCEVRGEFEETVEHEAYNTA